MRKTLLAAILVGTIAMPALAQDYSRNPSFGTYNLTAGFAPDPRVVNVTAGGQLAARNLARSGGTGCSGTVLDSTMANAPDVRVNYTAGSLPLTFSVSSSADTTLVINGPDGSWYCNDDTNGTDPAIRFASPGSGQYDVWVGVYGGGTRIPARLSVTELN